MLRHWLGFCFTPKPTKNSQRVPYSNGRLCGLRSPQGPLYHSACSTSKVAGKRPLCGCPQEGEDTRGSDHCPACLITEQGARSQIANILERSINPGTGSHHLRPTILKVYAFKSDTVQRLLSLFQFREKKRETKEEGKDNRVVGLVSQPHN